MGTSPSAAEPASRRDLSVRLGGRDVPVLLPRIRDPRLHVAAVIVSVQVLGQVVFDFDVSVAQILLCLGVCAVLEVPLTLWEKGVLAWPASALLTGNGVALLLRVPGTEHGDWWSLRGWSVFFAAAAVSVLSKYAIRHRGGHVFNPSNLGLVITFLAFGSARADPQDLWWGPWSPVLAATVALIVVGGVTLAARLRLFDVAITFWATFATGLAVVAVRGHSMTARWSIGPVTGFDYWRIMVSSPEILIFVFFMITDPRTTPPGRRARLAYAAGTGALAALLAAAQTTEYATKVALLGSLTIVCAARPLIERLVAPRVRAVPASDRELLTPRWVGAGLAVVGLFGGLLIVVATPARQGEAPTAVASASRVGGRPAVDVPDAAVPVATVAASVEEVDGGVDAVTASRMGRDLVEDLAIEARASRTLDPDLAATASFGARTRAIEAEIAAAAGRGQPFERRYDLDALEVVVLRDPGDPQARPQLGMVASGEVTDVVYSDGQGEEVQSQDVATFEGVFLVDEADGVFLIGREVAADDPMVRR